MDEVTTSIVGVPARAGDQSRAIGAILIDDGRLNPADIEGIQRYASENGLKFGDAAVRLNLLQQADVDFALARQFCYPTLSRGSDGGVADDVIAAHSPQSESVESLRTLRSQIVLRWLNHTTRKVLAIVSPQAGEGRSWLAANLATTFAQIGMRTLLIDANMRRPRQHVLFRLDNSAGLSALLSGRAGKDVARRIHPDLRLFVVPAGPVPPNPQELIARPVFDVVLDRYYAQFDLILLDTPPAADTADAYLVAARAGAAIMLVRRNYTRAAQLTAVMEGFNLSGATVIGTVVNEF
jgi:chain length determinant protein tyrosine kinase EpsG